MNFHQVRRAAVALCWMRTSENSSIFLCFLTHWNPKFINIFVCFSYSLKSPLFTCFAFCILSFPLILFAWDDFWNKRVYVSNSLVVFWRKKFTFQIHLFADGRCLSHRETWVEFDLINIIGYVQLSTSSFKLFISSLWTLHPSFVNPPFNLYLFFQSLIFSVPW